MPTILSNQNLNAWIFQKILKKYFKRCIFKKISPKMLIQN
ncbi:hypothetical protein CKA32_000442 [Geitlerinema sp. FC II]|nr:hypothetical protein CKA32_000442 [Geitlerinema sp. FC II]